MDLDLSLEISGIFLSEDVGHNCPTCDLLAIDALCARVYAADSI